MWEKWGKVKLFMLFLMAVAGVFYFWSIGPPEYPKTRCLFAFFGCIPGGVVYILFESIGDELMDFLENASSRVKRKRHKKGRTTNEQRPQRSC